MEVYSSIVDWQEAETRATRGFFDSDMDEEENETWRKDGDVEGVLSIEFLVGAACDSIFPSCTESNRQALADSFGRFLKEESDQWNELPCKLDPECHWLALSPSTVTGIRSAMRNVDFNELKHQYDIGCPKNVRDDLEYSPEEFIEHLELWVSLFEEACLANGGIMVTVG